MSESPEAEGQWPGWARYVVFGVLAALLVGGIVALAAGGSLEGATLRIVIAGVLIPVLLAPVQLAATRRRERRAREREEREQGG